jgi:acyl carrier protein
MSIKLAITSQMQKIADERNDKLAPLTDNLNLSDSGLDSLGFAILVARLEDDLGCDPFTESDEIHLPVTLGDFIRIYENADK